VVHFKIFGAVVLKENDQHAFIHIMPHEQVEKLLKRLEDISSVLVLAANQLGLRWFGIQEPFE